MKSLVNCHQCSAQFLKLNYRIKSSERHYCSRKCFGQDRINGRWQNHKKEIKFCKSCNILIDKRNKKGHCRGCCKSLGLNRCSEDTKKIISEKRKAYLKNNPDKHSWKLKTKFKSEPCESFKKILTDNNYKFLEEFTPTDSHSYSIDIVFPEKMIGIEINGNQHYERNGKLKKYYQERHDHIESHGWKLYEVHYSLCFHAESVLNLIKQAYASEDKVEFNYEEYVQKKLNKHKKLCPDCGVEFFHRRNIKCEKCIKQKAVQFLSTICENLAVSLTVSEDQIVSFNQKIKKEYYNLCRCGNRKLNKSLLCFSCNNHSPKMKTRRAMRPSKSELHDLVWSTPNVQLAKRFGVSDVAIAKWCKLYEIKKPDRGFWAKYEAKQILDYQI
jgi:very-short-patch-repair endonuclease